MIKQAPALTPVQKAFTLVMAALVLALALFYPLQAEAIGKKASALNDTTLSSVSYADIPDLTSAPEPLPKLSVLFFALPKLWAMLVAILATEIREYKAVFQQLFIQKIQFVFVSTLAP
jgi:hypothetical protein